MFKAIKLRPLKILLQIIQQKHRLKNRAVVLNYEAMERM